MEKKTGFVAWRVEYFFFKNSHVPPARGISDLRTWNPSAYYTDHAI